MTGVFRLVADRLAGGQATALATVVRTAGSSPVEVGARAVYGASGRRVGGWTGGGCIDGALGQAAIDALADGVARTIELDLSDEVLGVGLPCGGSMTVLVEALAPAGHLELVGRGPVVAALAGIGRLLGLEARLHGAGGPVDYPATVVDGDPAFERLAERDGAAVVVASGHKGDEQAIARALERGADYVALVASRSRGALVLERAAALLADPARTAAVRTPAGLAIGARTPAEIAVAIAAELVATRRAAPPAVR